MKLSALFILACAVQTGTAPAGPIEPGVPLSGQGAGQTGPAFRVVSARGAVAVRHGAAEEWVTVAAGDALKPEDSIRLEEGASATIGAGGKNIVLPAMVIVDVADLRDMTRGDLLLKLAMEDVRSAPRPDPGPGNPDAARTTTTRASNRDGGVMRPSGAGDANLRRLGGTKVLHDYGYYGTCVLRSKEIFRIEPALASRIDARLRVADALEKMNLRDEAYDAYAALAGENLPKDERLLVEAKMQELKK